MKYFFFIFSLSLFLSCSDDKPNDSNAKKSDNTESSHKENLAQSDNENLTSLDSYLIISALYEDFPSSKGVNNEINWLIIHITSPHALNSLYSRVGTKA
jgi:hypothetical protein